MLSHSVPKILCPQTTLLDKRLHVHSNSVFVRYPQNLPSWQKISMLSKDMNISKSSLGPTYVPVLVGVAYVLTDHCSNGRQTVGDGAFTFTDHGSSWGDPDLGRRRFGVWRQPRCRRDHPVDRRNRRCLAVPRLLVELGRIRRGDAH